MKKFKASFCLLTALALPLTSFTATQVHAEKITGDKLTVAKKETKRGWIKDSRGFWYHYGNDGTMSKSRWQGSYYLGADGRMVTNAWVYDNNYKAWYYLNADGSYAKNRWQGNYYLGSDGKMVTNAWVDNNRYYVGNDGAWVVGKKHLNGWVKENNAWYLYQNDKKVMNTWSGNYYLKADGKMATSEWIFDKNYNAWYYLNADGNYARNTWKGNYYLEANGKMATNKWIGNYYVDGSGKWIPGKKQNADSVKDYSRAIRIVKDTLVRVPLSKRSLFDLLDEEATMGTEHSPIKERLTRDEVNYIKNNFKVDYKDNALRSLKMDIDWAKKDEVAGQGLHNLSEKNLRDSLLHEEFEKDEIDYALKNINLTNKELAVLSTAGMRSKKEVAMELERYGFTKDEIDYALAHTKANYKERAKLRLRLNEQQYSEKELRKYLEEFDEFTKEEADYALREVKIDYNKAAVTKVNNLVALANGDKPENYSGTNIYSKKQLKRYLIYSEGFKESEAEYAVNNTKVDYLALAEKTIKRVLNIYSNYKTGSKKAIVSELISEGISEKDANLLLEKININYKENAVRYLEREKSFDSEYVNKDKKQLIDELTSETSYTGEYPDGEKYKIYKKAFTKEEAEYAVDKFLKNKK